MTYLNSSDTYFVGLKVHNNLVNISKGGYANIVFQLTAPIGCLYTDSVNINNSCVVSLEMVSLSSPSKCDSGNIAVVTKTDHCGPAINTTTKANLHTWTSDTIYTVQLTNADVNTGDRREYKVALKFPGNYQHRIWANYRSSFIDIHIGDDKPRGFCYSRVNSQVRTADGYCMNANVVGDLILYWNKKYDIMVQQRTTYCRNNQTTCVCALAIRAGSNVFVIDLCKSFSYIDYLMCEDVQTLKVELIEGTQNVYKIITPSGAKVVADILQLPLYRGYMNIDIYLSAKDFEEGQGLCGTYNGDMTDDLIHQDGLSSDLQQTVDCFLRRHDSFINSWR
ncbi:uncharacterized protein LOC127878769 [Dreissena polymorpha]|nr:uncharacterized protein LOC127878769 [Dreissena polymorpha]